MKIYSYNLNGIRAAMKKGFLDWLEAEQPDVICVQELKASENQITEELWQIERLGYFVYLYAAQKKGYSGVAIFTKKEPLKVVYGIDNEEFDAEGRNIRCDFESFSVMSLYLPSGTTGGIRQEVKMRYMEYLANYVQKMSQKERLIIGGDYNICHKPIDINKPQNKKGVSGFLPEEREWFSAFLEFGFTDSFRVFNQEAEQYSWWSYRAGSRARNVGWRIDYHLVGGELLPKLKAASIHPDAVHSDHCPVSVELDL